MNARRRIRDLNDLDTICSVQRLDLDMQVERAQARVRALEGRRDAETRTLAGLQDGWRQAVSGRSLDLAAAAFWSAGILRSEATIETLTADIRSAADRRQQLSRAQAAASARCEAVQDLLRSAVRRARNRRDEALMETYAIQTRSGWGQACE